MVHQQSRSCSVIVVREADDGGVVRDVYIHYDASILKENNNNNNKKINKTSGQIRKCVRLYDR